MDVKKKLPFHNSCHDTDSYVLRVPWLAVFTFPSRGRGWLEQILFVQSWSTHPVGVASMISFEWLNLMQLAQWELLPV